MTLPRCSGRRSVSIEFSRCWMTAALGRGGPLITKTDGNRYHIRMAIAGFSPEEVDVTQQGNTLTVTGQKTDNQDHAEMLHQGIAFNFRQTFNLTDHVKVVAADLE